MHCYECSQAGLAREAIGICHHCSAALCPDHACAVADPVMAQYLLGRTVILPKEARQILCNTCRTALEQPRAYKTARTALAD